MQQRQKLSVQSARHKKALRNHVKVSGYMPASVLSSCAAAEQLVCMKNVY